MPDSKTWINEQKTRIVQSTCRDLLPIYRFPIPRDSFRWSKYTKLFKNIICCREKWSKYFINWRNNDDWWLINIINSKNKIEKQTKYKKPFYSVVVVVVVFSSTTSFFKSEITKNARKKLVSLWMSRNVTSKMFLCFYRFVAWKQVSSLEGEVPQQSKWRFPRFAVYWYFVENFWRKFASRWECKP